MKPSTELATIFALAAASGVDLSPPDSGPKPWKPTFTDEELEEIRALPRKERKRAVRELRTKYFKLENP